MTRDGIVARARSLKGVPYRHQGRDPNVNGLDCIGLVLYVLQQEGWKPKNPGHTLRTAYGRWPDGDELYQTIIHECVEIPYEEILPADLLMMKWPDVDDEPRHLAIVSSMNPTYIVHTHWMKLGPDHQRSVSEHGFTSPWPERLVSCWRLKDFVEKAHGKSGNVTTPPAHDKPEKPEHETPPPQKPEKDDKPDKPKGKK